MTAFAGPAHAPETAFAFRMMVGSLAPPAWPVSFTEQVRFGLTRIAGRYPMARTEKFQVLCAVMLIVLTAGCGKETSQRASSPTAERSDSTVGNADGAASNPSAAPTAVSGKGDASADPPESSQASDVPAESGGIRRWNDASGNFSVEAEFLGLKDGCVRLKKKNGSTITVAVEKLSASDQFLIESQSKTEKTEAPTRPLITPAVTLEKLKHSFQVTGSIEQGLALAIGFESDYRGSNQTRTTYFTRRLKLWLANTGNVPLEFGDDLVVIEADAAKSKMAGMLVLLKQVEPPSVLVRSCDQPQRCFGVPDFDERYGDYFLYPNCVGGSLAARLYLNKMEISRELIDDTVPRSFSSNAPRFLRLTLNQGQFLEANARASLQVALPEIRTAGDGGTAKYRLVIHFAKKAAGQPAERKDGIVNREEWAVADREWFTINAEELKRVLADSDADPVRGILAANWLAEADPVVARGVLVQVAQKLDQGDLLTTCLILLGRLNGPGLEKQALALLQNAKARFADREAAAEYLGLIGCREAVSPLIALASQKDDKQQSLAETAVHALGKIGRPEGVDALVSLMGETKNWQRIQAICETLGQPDTITPAARSALLELAKRRDSDPLGNARNALVAVASKEEFQFFADLLATEADASRKVGAARGLLRCGDDRARDMLLTALKAEPPPSDSDPATATNLVYALGETDDGALLVAIAELAEAGNLRALQVLAHSKQGSVRPTLTKFAQNGNALQRWVAVDGLANNFPTESVEILQGALENTNPKIAAVAIRGLGASGEERVIPALLPCLRNKELAWEAMQALRRLPVGRHSGEYLEAILDSDDMDPIDLAAALIRSDWRDRTAIPQLAARMKTKEHYGLAQLMRHLSDERVGPQNQTEWLLDKARCRQELLDWAAKQ